MSVTELKYERINRSIADLRDAAQRWSDLPAGAKASLLREVKTRVHKVAPRWVAAAANAKGIAGTPLEGEEWMSGPYALLYALNRYCATLDRIERSGAPFIDKRRVKTRDDGTVVAEVFPNALYDRLLLNGIRAEVWMQAGVTAETLASTMGAWYRGDERRGRVALVLGAGNIASIAPTDVLYKLIAEGEVCILKMNPVNEYLGPILEEALEPLVREGFLRFAYGGADVGKYICSHEMIDEIHITGSAETHDAIVFGDGDDSNERKRRNDPVLRKPITSELGNVSPTIVVPGPWTAADFRFQAENIVTQKLHNGGFNCVASQVLVLPKDWNGTPRLLAEIERVMRDLADRPAYYPGASARRERFIRGRILVRQFGGYTLGATPRTLVRVRASDADDMLFSDEAFSSVLAYMEITGELETYLSEAVRFANQTLRGTLGANLIVHPSTMRKRSNAIEDAVTALEYGCIGVNAWTGVGFQICETTWGAYPGRTLDDVGSGIGVVHNSFLFSKPLKSVIYAPFAPYPRSMFGYGGAMLPKPPWFVTHASSARVGRALCNFEASKTPLNAARVAIFALRS